MASLKRISHLNNKKSLFIDKYCKSLDICFVPLRDSLLQLPKSVSRRQDIVHINLKKTFATLKSKEEEVFMFFRRATKTSSGIIYAVDSRCIYNTRKSGFNSCNIPGEVGGLVNKLDLSLLESD